MPLKLYFSTLRKDVKVKPIITSNEVVDLIATNTLKKVQTLHKNTHYNAKFRYSRFGERIRLLEKEK